MRSTEIIEAAGIDLSCFPPVCQSGTALGHITPLSAGATNLPEITVVSVGLHDHICGAFAPGGLSTGDFFRRPQCPPGGVRPDPDKRSRSDEWNSQYYVAWPILKEFGYPFTLFIYTQWVNTGGKAMTWNQLEEMRDAGVDIEAHTVSHRDAQVEPEGGSSYAAKLFRQMQLFLEVLNDVLEFRMTSLNFGRFSGAVLIKAS